MLFLPRVRLTTKRVWLGFSARFGVSAEAETCPATTFGMMITLPWPPLGGSVPQSRNVFGMLSGKPSAWVVEAAATLGGSVLIEGFLGAAATCGDHAAPERSFFKQQRRAGCLASAVTEAQLLKKWIGFMLKCPTVQLPHKHHTCTGTPWCWMHFQPSKKGHLLIPQKENRKKKYRKDMRALLLQWDYFCGCCTYRIGWHFSHLKKNYGTEGLLETACFVCLVSCGFFCFADWLRKM